jgi:peroxiredoxin (alkyl hydroperoxide reductase subunit C)
MAVLVGREAPDFEVSAVKDGQVVEKFSLSQFRGKKYVVLFFYPLDFTFVCPTELHEFEAKRKDFEALGAELIGCSIDSPHSHIAWLNTPINKGGIQGVQYPLISDLNKTVAQDYDVLLPAGMALRASFVIDKAGIVQIQHVNNLDIGRSIDEVYRGLQALQFTEEHGEVCPANWQQGNKAMKATREGVEGFFSAK